MLASLDHINYCAMQLALRISISPGRSAVIDDLALSTLVGGLAVESIDNCNGAWMNFIRVG